MLYCIYRLPMAICIFSGKGANPVEALSEEQGDISRYLQYIRN